MRFLKTLTLNRRSIYDPRAAVDVNNTFTVATTTDMILPKSNGSLTTVQTEGMVRYNTTSHEIEVFSGNPASWRTLRYKEATGITRETYVGDNATQVYGPLSTQPPTTVESGTTWTGDNLIVIVGNVYQTWTDNYLIKTGVQIGAPYDTGPDSTKFYIQFTSTTPGLSTPIVILHGFDQ
jgi:hypothetical protein